MMHLTKNMMVCVVVMMTVMMMGFLVTNTQAASLPDQSVEREVSIDNTPSENLYPVIGILSQQISRKMSAATDYNYTSYIAASYVKYMETGGARVVPIMINQNESYYRDLLNVVNGVVFPGGSAFFRNTSIGYGQAGSIIYDLIQEAKVERNETIPLLAICLGFEMLLFLDAGKINPLSRCNASNLADPLYLKPGYKDSELIGGAPQDILQTLTTTNSTSNFHKYCVTPEKFEELGLDKNYTLVSTSYDKNGTEYISTVEHKSLPIYGTQWHPEKNLYEWAFQSIPHTREAVRAVQYIANEFVAKARQNSPRYSDPSDQTVFPLIYNFKPIYIRKLYKSSFQQCYFF